MSILIDGTEGDDPGHTRKDRCIPYAPVPRYPHGANLVAGVNPHKAGEDSKASIFATAAEAKQKNRRHGLGDLRAAPFAAGPSMRRSCELDLVICITEGVPVRDMIATRKPHARQKDLLVGSNCPGDHAGRNQDRHMPATSTKGGIGVVSRRTRPRGVGPHDLGLGQSTCGERRRSVKVEHVDSCGVHETPDRAVKWWEKSAATRGEPAPADQAPHEKADGRIHCRG